MWPIVFDVVSSVSFEESLTPWLLFHCPVKRIDIWSNKRDMWKCWKAWLKKDSKINNIWSDFGEVVWINDFSALPPLYIIYTHTLPTNKRSTVIEKTNVYPNCNPIHTWKNKGKKIKFILSLVDFC